MAAEPLTITIRSMRYCSVKCPMFEVCPVMPLAVKPEELRDRVCLVNAGTHDLRMAYINLFLRGEDGLIEEIKRGFVNYLKETELLEEAFKPGKGEPAMGGKERERLLVHREKMMGMLMALHKTMYGEKKTIRHDNKPVAIKMVEIGSEGQPVRLIREDRKLSEEEKAEFEVLEQKVMEAAAQDPESLVFSEKIQKEILPSMRVVDIEEVHPIHPAAQEEVPVEEHPLLKKFFAEEE